MIRPEDIIHMRAVFRIANYYVDRSRIKVTYLHRTTGPDGVAKTTKLADGAPAVKVIPLGNLPEHEKRPEYVPGVDLILATGESCRVLHRGVDFKYSQDWPWTTVLMDPVAVVDCFGPADQYIVLARNMYTGLFLLHAKETRGAWTTRVSRGVRHYESPAELWLCDSTTYDKTHLVPEWKVWKGDTGNDVTAVRFTMQLHGHGPFNGHELAPVVNRAMAAGYHVAMMAAWR